MKYKITPICFSVHREDESPIYGELSVHIRIEDEAAGPFLVIKSQAADEFSKSGEIALEFEHFDAISEAVKRLREGNPA